MKYPIAPMGKWLTCLPRLSLAQLQPTLWSTTGCACRRDLEKFPWPRWENADTLALILACITATDASVNYRRCVPQRPSKVPIAPMGFSHILRVRLQGGGVYVNGGSVTFSSCTITGNSAGNVRAHAQKFPLPRWDFHMFCACVCRAAVSLSRVAR